MRPYVYCKYFMIIWFMTCPWCIEKVRFSLIFKNYERWTDRYNIIILYNLWALKKTLFKEGPCKESFKINNKKKNGKSQILRLIPFHSGWHFHLKIRSGILMSFPGFHLLKYIAHGRLPCFLRKRHWNTGWQADRPTDQRSDPHIDFRDA